MEKLEVFGANKLKGQVRISGSKNASLPILAATLLSDKKIHLSNLPKVKDIETMLLLLKSLKTKIKYLKNNKLVSVENNKKNKTFVSYALVKTMRAGILVLGSLLARYSKAKVSLPGGCEIGTRPIDIHLKALSKLGVKYKITQGYVYAEAPKGLVGAKIKFPKISVGATENLIIAASLAKGQTILSNCATEPEIKDLVNFLNKMGCKINWIGKKKVKILGVKKLNDVSYKIMPDRIEAGTYAMAAVITSGKIKLLNAEEKYLITVLSYLRKAGALIKYDTNSIEIEGPSIIKSANLKTEVYPGFPTDLQAQAMALMTIAKGNSIIEESIFENRFMHIAELVRFGADISVEGVKAYIKGCDSLNGAQVMATDLRASSSLILAGLKAEGETIINRVYHLDRGYEKLEQKLSLCGARIKRI